MLFLIFQRGMRDFMSNKGHSDPNIFGGYTNYDEKGHRVGTSDPNIWGGYDYIRSLDQRQGEEGILSDDL
jgi:hypothetical protein